jgi:hypothetical protein
MTGGDGGGGGSRRPVIEHAANNVLRERATPSRNFKA